MPSSHQAKGKEKEVFHADAGGTTASSTARAKIQDLTHIQHIVNEMPPPFIPSHADTPQSTLMEKNNEIVSNALSQVNEAVKAIHNNNRIIEEGVDTPDTRVTDMANRLAKIEGQIAPYVQSHCNSQQ